MDIRKRKEVSGPDPSNTEKSEDITRRIEETLKQVNSEVRMPGGILVAHSVKLLPLDFC